MSSGSNRILVSVVVPCFNAVGKMDACIRSLSEQSLDSDTLEVILVDDCSDDGSQQVLSALADGRPNWRVILLDRNSGSPSRPRNLGTAAARGEYVLYLDIDDELPRDALRRLLDHARRTEASIVRGSMLVTSQGKSRTVNVITPFDDSVGRDDRIARIISQQSTIVTQLIRRDLLTENEILWDEEIRMGEDTLFLLRILLVADVIEYLDEPILVYHRVNHGSLSSTQRYGNLELRNHLFVWAEAERLMQRIGLSYWELRLRSAVDAALTMLVRYGTEVLEPTLFSELSALVIRNRDVLEKSPHWERIGCLYDSLYSGSYDDFCERSKRRLLIAGTDLKFIRSAIPRFQEEYQVEVDEWAGADSHDKLRSEKLLAWADIIFCEWALGNAVWYSRRKKAHQVLLVRCHRYELSTPFPARIAIDRVDAVLVVSVHFVETLLDRTGWSRGKVRLVPNYLLVDGYRSRDSSDRPFRLAMIGVVPARKGLHRGIELLDRLREVDDRYTLQIYGKKPEEFPWILRDPVEVRYYDDCAQAIVDRHLEDHVFWEGWVDVRVGLAGVGFVLSLSSSAAETPHNLPESFHLAPADGFLAGGIGLFLDWDGVEYVYPADYIFDSLDQLAEYILEHRDVDAFSRARMVCAEFIREAYSLETFAVNLDRVIRQVR